MSQPVAQPGQPVALLVGGTKIIERTLQEVLTAPLVIVGTMEEAMRIMGEKNVALTVLGPTLRRSLAEVATLRREGQTDPRLIVVYRDDLREEVKRHMRGKNLADRYVTQSRIGKELAPAASELWAQIDSQRFSGQVNGAGQTGTTGELDEIPLDAMEELTEGAGEEVNEGVGGAAQGIDGSSLQALPDDDAAYGDEAPPPRPGEVLGAFDARALDRGGEAEHEEFEEIDDFESLEELPALEELELDGEALQLDSADPRTSADAQARAQDDGTVEELSGDELIEEELDSELLNDEILEFEEIDADELLDDLAHGATLTHEATPGAAPAAEPGHAAVHASQASESAAADADLEADMPELLELDEYTGWDEDPTFAGDPGASAVPAEAELTAAPQLADVELADAELSEAELLDAELVDAATLPDGEGELPPAPAVVAPVFPPLAHRQAQRAPLDPVHFQPAPSPAPSAAPPVAAAPAASGRPVSGAHMFTELAGFAEKLQDAARMISALEGDNDHLRHELTRAQSAARPELETELSALRSRMGELQLRLEGAEEARSAAVEARTKAELTAQGRDDELARLRHDLAASQTRESALESQLDARQRIAHDAAKSLRAISSILD